MPLRGTRRLRLTTSGPSVGKPEVLAGRRPFVVVERPEAVGVDTGRHQHARQRTTRGALALGQRVAAGGDHQSGAAEHVTQQEVRSRQPAGHGDLGAVQHDGVRTSEPGPDQPDRQRGVEHHPARAHLVGQRVDPPDERRRGQQDLLAGAHHPVRLLGVPRRGRPSYGVVSTAKVDGSRRRHSSQSIVWIPPSLGGKSLVTNRWVIGVGRRARRGPRDRSPARSAGADPRVRAAAPPRRRGRAAADRRARGSARRRSTTTGSSPIADVAEHDERVATHVADVALRDVPASGRASTTSSSGSSRSTRSAHGVSSPVACTLGRAAVRRAHLLALVAAVDAVAERDAVLERERALGLEEPRQAAAGVDHAGRGDRAGRATVEAAAAGTAPIVDGRRRRRPAARR